MEVAETLMNPGDACDEEMQLALALSLSEAEAATAL